VIVALVSLLAGLVSCITTQAWARHLSGSHAFWTGYGDGPVDPHPESLRVSRLLGTLVGISFVGISFVFSGIDLLGFRASFHAVERKRPSST